MTTLKLNSDNDLDFTNRGFVVLQGTNTDDEILQRMRVRLNFFKGEWFLNSEHGLPYFQDILGVTNIDLNAVSSLFREQLLSVEGVREIQESEIDYDKVTRKITYIFSALSVNNTVITNKP
tara:strand:- start:2745 stop:3107 length:363 start_codon:yes stop_codon:yes gene_type:complete